MAADEKVDKLEQKKQQLEAELNNIQSQIDDSIDRVRHDVSDKLDPKSFVRKHPLPVVGGAVLVGFLLGHNDKHKSSGHSSSEDAGGGLTSTLIYELKRLATKKALSFATNFMEKKVDEKTSELAGITNGEAED